MKPTGKAKNESQKWEEDQSQPQIHSTTGRHMKNNACRTNFIAVFQTALNLCPKSADKNICIYLYFR